MKYLPIIAVLFSFIQCKTIKLEQNPPFKIEKASYHHWNGGQPGVSGTNIEIKLEKNSNINFDSIFFQNKSTAAEISTTANGMIVIGNFNSSKRQRKSLILDSMNMIIEIGQTTKNIDDIQGQYIGLMKFQGSGLKFLRNFYKKTKEESKKTGENPLNPNIDFKKSYMTDFIQGLINAGCKIKAISINNGWLELDNNDDYRIYNKMHEDGKLSEFIELENRN